MTGSLSSAGTQTITVTYSGKTTTFTVNVVSASKTLTGITAVYNQNGKSITTASSVNDVATSPAMLTVTAHYDDSSSETLVSGAYALSGTLTAGTSTITVSYGGKTATFQVTVTAVDLTSINVAFT